MSEKYDFTMLISGKSTEVQEFIDTIFNENKGLQINEREQVNTSEENLVSVHCKGFSDQSLNDVLSKYVNQGQQFIVEAYGMNKENNVQEHILLDRGQILAKSQETYTEHKLSELSPQEMEDLLFEEGMNRDELLKNVDANGIYKTSEMEFYGEFSDHMRSFEHEPRKFIEYQCHWGEILDPTLEALGLVNQAPDISTYYVTPALDMYRANNNLYIGFGYYDEDIQAVEHFSDVTVNVGSLPYLHSAIDTNNNGNAIVSWLQKNGYGEPTGHLLTSGFCQFPVFRFNKEKLQEIDPAGFAEYAKAHGHTVSQDRTPLDEKIQQAKNQTIPQNNKEINLEPER